ncbi:hypothetical protein [Actinoallomurus sp. NPDC052274]|uniref:hypothetical protein n=1 Tax=Actinoallomurus sp. NPDC052274 TaxID=3155420 RepID=UPI003424BB51
MPDQMRCPHGLRFPLTLLDQLRRIPYGANEINAVGWCSLVEGHSGPHHALGQSGGEDDHWVRWTDAGIEVTVLPFCPTVMPEDEDQPCTLFDGHEGPHDYELEDYPTTVDQRFAAYYWAPPAAN